MRRVSDSANRKLRRDLSEDFAEPYEDFDVPATRRGRGVRVRFRGLPATKWGRIFAGLGLLVLLGMGTAAFLMAQSYLLHDARFVIPSSASIVFEGNSHVTRAQLLGIFGEDVDRNIFTVSLDERRAQLERLPWVAHATVMRLLPNRMRVSIVERTPVAFVRQGSRIGLVDGNGVLLDMPVGSEKREHYSFPVVTGISANEPLSTRAARMKIFERFTSELDGAGDKAAGEKISEQLSEVDLSNPEDAQALIPDHSTEILVHFGEDNFLERYQRFKEHLPEWKTLYPKLSAVDMRYERQVVLQMPPGSGASATTSSNSGASVVTGDTSATGTTADPVEGTEVTPSVKPQAKPAAKSAVKTPTAIAKRAAATKSATHVAARSEVAFDAQKKNINAKTKKRVVAAKHHPVVVKHSASATQYHPTQAVHP
jgi:cell division protein FtsQ